MSDDAAAFGRVSNPIVKAPPPDTLDRMHADVRLAVADHVVRHLRDAECCCAQRPLVLCPDLEEAIAGAVDDVNPPNPAARTALWAGTCMWITTAEPPGS